MKDTESEAFCATCSTRFKSGKISFEADAGFEDALQRITFGKEFLYLFLFMLKRNITNLLCHAHKIRAYTTGRQ